LMVKERCRKTPEYAMICIISKVGRFFDRTGESGNSSVYEYLSEERQLHVSLSNPFKTMAIASAKIKTDKLDAVKLADLLEVVT